MDIKDYLHLYLGCEVAREHEESRSKKFFERGKLIGIAQSEIEKDKIVAILDVGIDHFHEWYIEETKPILRRLSSMTEEEAKDLIQFDKLCKEYQDVSYNLIREFNDKILIGIDVNYSIVDPDEGVIYPHGWEMRFSSMNAYDFKWLLSKHFDLFGLIAAGLAIEKDSL